VLFVGAVAVVAAGDVNLVGVVTQDGVEFDMNGTIYRQS
jgi:hypothetical protein